MWASGTLQPKLPTAILPINIVKAIYAYPDRSGRIDYKTLAESSTYIVHAWEMIAARGGHAVIFTNWKPEHAAKFANEPVLLQHNLHHNELLSEDSLAEIIDLYNKRGHRYLLTHMGPLGASRQSWKEYRIGRMSGRQLIDRIRNERLWISLHDINKVTNDYQRLLDSVFDEVRRLVPGHPETFQRTCGVLISSPGAQVYYHFDTSGQTLWQIQGNKTVRLYPCKPPFLTQERVDMVTAFRESFFDESTQPWRPEFDSGAIDFRGNGDLTLNPGEMVYWPLNMPHRIENGDQMSISFTTEFYTKEIKRHVRSSTANGILRTFGWKPSVTKSGPLYYAKLGVTAVAKGTGWLERRQRKPVESKTLADMPTLAAREDYVHSDGDQLVAGPVS